jgi:hypothetical protein
VSFEAELGANDEGSAVGSRQQILRFAQDETEHWITLFYPGTP